MENSLIAQLEFQRPERLNAFTRDDALSWYSKLVTWREQIESGDQNAPKVLIVSGQGRAFSAGADLDYVRELSDMDSSVRAAELTIPSRLVTELITFPAPTVAVVQGAAYGGGACLALACDHVIAEDTAKFGFIFTRLGLPGGDMSAPWLLQRRVGTRQAFALLSRSAELSATQAHALGVVDQLTPSDERDQVLDDLMQPWLDLSPEALRATKHQVLTLEGAWDQLPEQTAAELAEMNRAFDSPALRDAVN